MLMSSRTLEVCSTCTLAGIIFFFVATIPLTHAQNAEPSGAGQNAVDARQGNRDAREPALSRNTQERVINLSRNIINRLTAAVERMDNIIARLETRIEKLKVLGVDTTSAEIKLTDAKNALAAAKDTLEELNSVETSLKSDAPRAAFRSIRTQFIGAHDLIKQTRTLLAETVALLKDAVKSADLGSGASNAVQNDGKTGTPITQ